MVWEFSSYNKIAPGAQLHLLHACSLSETECHYTQIEKEASTSFNLSIGEI